MIELKALESIPEDAIILVGFSGGADSMTLLYSLKQLSKEYGWKIIALYVHHGLRDEANQEAIFLSKWCASQEIDYRVKKVDVPKYAKKRKKTIEEAAHDLRYKCFFEMAQKEKVDILALGHHAGDRAETFLMHLLRGAGIEGLSAMPVREGWIWRPLVEYEKEDILDFCKQKDLPFVTDQSNNDLNCQRNRIRHELIPLLKEWHPHISKQIAKTAERLEQESHALNTWADSVKKNVRLSSSDEKISWSIPALLELPIALRKRIIFKDLMDLIPEARGLNATQWEILMGIIVAKESKRLPFYDRWMFKTSSDVLYLCKEEQGEDSNISYSIYWKGEKELILPFGKISILANKNGKSLFSFVTRDKGLKIRSKKQGDRIRITNLGRKSLKKIFQEQGIPIEERAKWPIVENDREIVWIPGLAIAEGYDILDTTKDEYIVLEWKR